MGGKKGLRFSAVIIQTSMEPWFLMLDNFPRIGSRRGHYEKSNINVRLFTQFVEGIEREKMNHNSWFLNLRNCLNTTEDGIIPLAAGLRLGGSPPSRSFQVRPNWKYGNSAACSLSLSPSSVFPSLTCLLSGHYHPTIMVGGTFGAENSQAKSTSSLCDINCNNM